MKFGENRKTSLRVLLALLLLPVARKYRDVLALLLSGIAIDLTLLPLASSPDFRYSHWLVTSVTISTIVLVARRNQLTTTP